MSYKRFDVEDIVISSDAISAPAWLNNVTELSSFFTASVQSSGDTGQYFLNIYKSGSTAANDIQFTVGYGNIVGSGSLQYNSNILGYSPSSVVYKQFRSLVLGDEESSFVFGTHIPEDIYVLSLERSRYKEKLLPGTFEITLTTPSGSITLIDDSSTTSTLTFTDAGRVYNIVTGSITNGVYTTGNFANGFTPGSGSYGKLLPDIGVVILNADALDGAAGSTEGGIAIGTETSQNSDDQNNRKLFDAISTGASFKLNSEETLSSNFIFVRARNSEFNYSTNPSNITGSGELRHSVMIDSPQSYITSVGLYNDNNDLLAVAKLSRPLLKDFTKEALIRIKLDY